MFFNSQERKINFGLLVMRVGLAVILLIHSMPGLVGGAAYWKRVGTGLSFINVGFPPEVIGFVIMLLESLGALSLLFGYLFKTFSIVLAAIYCLYFFNYYNNGYRKLMVYSLSLASVFIGFMNTGPGRYSIAVKLEKRNR
ncbi:MAG: DoxX family protein [Desulfobacterales bacterium]|nr:DoxX family protein [Desulfobacterales bacterium]MDX2509928.1 DoxX family protein [Desulfobacterales bacterium]